MFVRIASTSDAGVISRIAAAVFHMACPPGTPQTEIDAYLDECLTPAALERVIDDASQCVRVAVIDEIVVGFSVLVHEPDEIGVLAADGIPELTRLYVSAQHQGNGIAQMLIARTLEDVSARVRLMVNDTNGRAISFYRRNGFQEVGAVSFHCAGDVHCDIVMVRG